jgi:intracellular septation protein
MVEKQAREMPTGTKLAVDFGPLLVFFAINSLYPGGDLSRAIAATFAFMMATGVAMIVSKLSTGRISPMLWVTGVVVLVFGALTIYLRDERFIQIKPTIVYATFALVLGFGMVTKRPVLKSVLETGFPTMDDEGWRKLTRNWTLFFVAMAVLNEVMRAAVSFDAWVNFKVWGVTLISFIFAMSQAPILLRHGAQADQTPPPPTQG